MYKVAELLGTTSQEVTALLKRDHGIDVKSASSTIEEVVARQFVERLARQRNIALPSGDIFAEGAAARGKKPVAAGKKAEPPKPSAALPPPRLVKTPRPVPKPEGEPEAPSAEGEIAAAEPEPQPAPLPPQAPPSAAPRAAPPPVGRVVPPTLRLRIEEPRRAERLAPPATPAAAPFAVGPAGVPDRPVVAELPLVVPEAAAPTEAPTAGPAPERPAISGPARIAPPPAASAPPTAAAGATAPRPPVGRLVPPRGARPGGPATGAPSPFTRQPARPTTLPRPAVPVTGGPRPLPSQPVRPQTARPGGPFPARPATQFRPSGGARPGPPMAARPVAPRRDRDLREARLGPSVPTAPVAPPPITRTITLAEGMSVKDLADKLEIKAKDVLKKMLDRRMIVTINSTLDPETATSLAREFGADVQMRSFEEELLEQGTEAVKPEDLTTRAPVVTVMGHVDHGKTTLLDAIRETRVAEREAGGITQHIGAYHVQVNRRSVVFLDTPGHEAFTLMRARGARVTDIVVLVVAADDGVMPQTREAIDHAKAAGVPIIVAINKVDKADANPDRVRRELSELGLVPEDWGGQTVMVEVSAKKKQNLELLLEMVLLVADIGELKASAKRAALGTVLEAKLDKGRGPVATILVQEGTLHVGDTVVTGAIVGRIRALIDDRGRHVKVAPPSTPVEVLGLSGLPQPGDSFQAIADAAKARQVAMYRQTQAKEKALGAKGTRLTLESLQQQIAEGNVKELPIIIKADVQGSAEVLADTLTKLSDEKVKVRTIHAGVGAINESDVLLASASNAIIIGFNVRPDRNAVEVAERERVEIRMHSVIYNVTDEIKKAMVGLLEPTFKEVHLGSAEIREVFRVPKVGSVAGCMVLEGRIARAGDTQVRLLRDHVVVHEGKIGSLRRFKDDVSEVKSGLECGIALDRFNDIKVGDVIDVYTVERVATTV
ncbi:MAG: translation initiation factor IF-2 [Acidobacteria bacterium]|nr:translation initiation factor IF-2 [Acidobacteriota bacterium]